jgi:hypothetical protein
MQIKSEYSVCQFNNNVFFGGGGVKKNVYV